MTTATAPRRLQLYRYQEDAFKAVFEAERRGVTRQIVSLPTGGGKCLGIGTKVMRFDGRLVNVEDVQAGDDLMGPDSTPRRVLSTTRGHGPLYRIVPVRGEPWVCNDVHVLSLVHTQTGDIVDIELPDYLAASNNFRHLHKQFAPPHGVDFPPLPEPPIGAYFLGIWLGDGAKRFDRVAVSKPDPEIREAVEAEAERWGLSVRTENSKSCPSFYIHGERGAGNPLMQALRDIVPADFSIPHAYLYGSRMRRAEVLAGLVDTDGYIHNGSLEIVQKLQPLADSITFLARSLGFRVLRSVKVVNGEPYHRMNISGDLSTIPARIARKQGAPRRQLKCATRTGFSVEAIGPGEYAGFELDGDGRFLLGDFTVTHNTVLAAHLIGDRRPAVFMCHRDELVTQTVEKLNAFDPTLSVTICKAERGRYAWELSGHDVVIASAQTLAREARLAELRKAVPDLPLLIVDEAHHSAAATWTRTIETLAPRLLIGLTATPRRGDGVGLDGLFEEIVYSLPMRDLVEVGKLARPIGLRVGTSVDLGAVHSRGGEFVESELSTVINTPERNALVVDAWEKHIRDGGRKRTIAFCVDVAHANDLCATFRGRGHVADVVTGATPPDERARMYRDLKSGVLPVLISVMVLTEGFDEPLVDSALMCRPTQSQALYIQMAGRALRQAAGKPDALIIDFVDVTARHNLQTILTLAGDAPVDAPDEEGPLDLFAGVDAAEMKAAQAESRKARIRSGAELLGDLLGVAPVVWQRDGDRWFASTGDKAWISVIPFDGGFAPLRIREDGFEFLFDRSVDAQTAMNVAQAAVPMNTLTKRDADWRNGLASEKQLRILRLPPETYMSRGEASELIDRKFFARAFKESGASQIEETA